MLYLDTSVVVAILTSETHTSRAQAWIAAQLDSDIAVSPWVETELSAALAAKLRLRAIDEVQRQNAIRMYDGLRADTLTLLAISTADFAYARQLASNPDAALRGGDALHFAVAARHGATLCTLDRQQALACAASSLESLLI